MKPDILLDLFFTDQPLAERIARIADAGWRAIETWKGGDAAELKSIGDACRDRGVELVSIVLNGPGDAAVAPVDADKRAAFLDRIDRYSDNALAAGCGAGIVCSGNRVGGRGFHAQKQALVEALSRAAELAERKKFRLNLEPLNDQVDHAGYFLVSREEAVDIAHQVNSPWVRVLYDLYHQQIMAGNHLSFLAANIGWIGHFHAAGVPGRHELFTGEMDYALVVRRIREMGYAGTFGLEYFPGLEHGESLRRAREYLEPSLG
jgi:hydroxypyruvate isomerase